MYRSLCTFAALGILLILVACGGGGDSATPPAASPQDDLVLNFIPIATGISSPTTITHAGDGSNRIFLAQQTGIIRVVSNANLLATPFLDISNRLVSGGERGLLGLAFPPDFAAKGYFYLNYTRSGDGATVVSRFFVSADNPDIADAESEQILLEVNQPFANHNGGQLAFGPDGYLYIGLGDGGSANDPQGNSQNPATLLGKLLRIDVEAGVAPYRIPDDNPFVNVAGVLDEIWASGLRNPWCFSFDRLSGDLYVADVGQNRWEEINFQPAGTGGGANYGWNILEGPDCLDSVGGCVEPAGYAAPVVFYDHDLGCSVTGGYVYRDPANALLQGRYLYGDFCSGRIWALQRSGNVWEQTLLDQTPYSISVFGEDEAGRLYVADYATGTIYRLDVQ